MNIVVGRSLSDAQEKELLSAAGPQRLRVAPERDQVVQAIPDAEAYIAGPWSEDIFAAAQRLKWVHFGHAGVERDLFPALAASDVVVTNAAGAFALPMAEHAIALILAYCRGLHVCIRRPRASRETRARATSRIGELTGATVGVIGYGGTGRAVARLARSLGMHVLAAGSAPRPGDDVAEDIWGPGRLGELLEQSDYVVVSCALTEKTRGLIGRPELARMKPTAVLINVARGAVIRQDALVEALREGRIAGAGLDVTDPEPLPPDDALWDMENVIITPHISGHAPSTSRHVFELMRENIRRYVRGEELLNVVDKQAGY